MLIACKKIKFLLKYDNDVDSMDNVIAKIISKYKTVR